LIVTLTWIDSVTNQPVNFTSSHTGSSSFAGVLPGTFTITVNHAQGLQSDLTAHAATAADVTLGADQTLTGPDFSFQVPGSTGLLHHDNLAIGNLFHHI